MQALTLPRPDAAASSLRWVVVGVACGLAAAVWGSPAALACALALAAAAAVVDARLGRLPDPILAAAAVPVAVAGAASALTGHGADAWSVVAGAALLSGPLLIAHLVAPSSLGFGDVKLGSVLGATCGLFAPVLALVALCVASGATLTFGVATRRREVPFGPGLVAGAVVAVVMSIAAGAEAVAWR